MNYTRLTERFSRRISYEVYRFFLLKKRIYHLIKSSSNQKRVLFIVGCQRSGTSILLRTFGRDINARTYEETSNVTTKHGPCPIRLNSPELVRKEIEKNTVPLVVLKPLADSQNILSWLDYFSGSKALWMYRNYTDVASSYLKLWGIRKGVEELRTIVENEPGNWRSERVPATAKKLVLKHFSENMNPYDAAVLFWYVRNSLYFDLQLDKNPDVLMCKYEDLATSPGKVMSNIYKAIGCNYPGDKTTKKIHPRSIRKGADIELSPIIDDYARDLWANLESAYRNKQRLLGWETTKVQ